MSVRSLQEIEQQITDKASEYDALAALNHHANAISLWRALVSVFAFAAQYIEKLMYRLQNEIDAKMNTQYIGDKQWYQQLVRDYQHGDPLSIIDGRIGYATVDDNKKIISQVHCSDSNTPGQIIIKALKQNAQPLSVDERAGMLSYLNQVKIVGTHIILKSLPAEKIKLNLTIEINKQVFKANGNRIQDGAPTIYNSLEQYLATLPFDDVFYLSKVVDHLQAIEGVKDVQINSAQTENGQPINRKYTPESGHLTLHEKSQMIYVSD